MRKTILLLAVAVLTAFQASAQLLYKVSGNGLERPSYLMGTHHLASAAFVQNLPGVKDALVGTDQVYGEIVIAHMQNPDTLSMARSKMFLPDGKTLRDVLSPAEFKELDAYFKTMMGVGLSSPQVMEKMGRMVPKALESELTKVLFMSHHMGEYDPSSSPDQYFQLQAVKNNEPVGGLETVSQQAAIVFAAPMARQVEVLMCLVRNSDEYARQLDELTEAYYAQDLARIEKGVNERFGTSCDVTPDEQRRLVDDRNDAWMKVMPAIMAQHPTFFAVGVGHLIGGKGLLSQLRAAGYTVEGVN